MGNMTLSLPEDIHAIIRRHTEIKWSEIARQAMADYARMLEMLDKLAEKSKLTQEDVMEIDPEIKSAIFKHYGKYVK